MVVALAATMLMVQSFFSLVFLKQDTAQNKLRLNADDSASVQSDETLNTVSLVNNFHSNIQHRKSSGVQGSDNANGNRINFIQSLSGCCHVCAAVGAGAFYDFPGITVVLDS